jgi:Tfp pilus assembly protein PilE
MITVAIVGLLASIAIPSFTHARQTSQKNICISHLVQISSAKDQYALSHNGTMPTDLTDFVPDIIKRLPVCPRGGSYLIGVLGVDPTCNQAAEGHSL